MMFLIRSIRMFLMLAAAVLLVGSLEILAQYKGSPVRKDKLVKVLRSKQLPTREIVAVIKKNGVDFQVTPAVEDELIGAGARNEIIAAASDNYRAPRSGKKPPPPSKTEANDEAYDVLYYQGLDGINQLGTATTLDQAAQISRSIIATGNKAVKLDPARPDAYKLICTAQMVMRNFADAAKQCQLAIDRGGSLRFPVYHLNAGTPHLEMLYVGAGSLSIESNQKLVQFTGREISGVRNDNDHSFNGLQVMGFSIQADRDGNSEAWCFSPAITETAEEASMIMQLIQRNAVSGR